MIGAETQDPQVVRGQIDAVIRAISESWNAHDISLHGRQFTEDADFVNVLGMYWHGRAEIESHHATIHRTIFRNSKLRILDYSLRPIADEVVLGHIRWEMTGHEPLPGVTVPETRTGMATAVFVQRDGRWLISAFHNTDIVPVVMPS